MPARPDPAVPLLKVCAAPGCPALVPLGVARCPAHARRPWAHRVASRRARGYGREWERRRALVLEEGPWCAGCGAPATTVDHVIPKAEGGTDARSNLRALCAACQQRKAGREGRRAQLRGGEGGIDPLKYTRVVT